MPGQSAAKIFALAKGFRGRANNCITITRTRVERAMQHSYKGRKHKVRDFRSNWIVKINAGARELGIKYSTLMHEMPNSNIVLNRRMLSMLAEREPYSFRAVVDTVKQNAVSPIPIPSTWAADGHVISNVVVSSVPVGKLENKKKIRRKIINYY